MKNLHITVADKIATYLKRDGVIVCANKGEESGYQIVFAFDAEWSAYTEKTARFIWNGKYYDQPFEGNECPVPIISNTTEVTVGVYAGDLSTTTPASIPCKKSILCTDARATEGLAKDYVDEALQTIEEAGTEAVETVKNAADNFAAEIGVVQSTGDSTTSVMSQKAATEAFMELPAASAMFANAIKATAKGEVVRIEDAVPVQHNLAVKVGGVADPTNVRVTRSGKNLVRTYRYDSSFNYNGLTAVINDDNSITFNGTATGTIYYELIVHNRNSFSLRSGNYVFSLGAQIPAGCRSSITEYDNGAQIREILSINALTSYGVVYSDHWIDTFSWYIQIPTGTELNNFTVYPQIESGTAPTEYEKPNYQTLTPNADGTIDGLKYVSPITIISTDNAGAILEVEYNKDVETYVEEMMEKQSDDFANKLIENQSNSANAIKAIMKGKVTLADNISPIPHNARVIVSGVADPTSVIVKTRGKNLIPKVCPSQVINGITFDIQPDGSVIANGTATADAALYILPLPNSVEMGALPKGEYYYKLFGLQSGMTATAAWVDRKGNWLGTIGVDTTGGGFSFVVDENNVDNYSTFRFNVLSGTTVNNAHIYPMLSYGEMPTAFKEYVGQDYTPDTEGVISNIVSYAPSMLIFTDTDGAILEVEYNVDINKAINDLDEKINEAVTDLGENISEAKAQLQDVNASLSSFSNAIKATASGEVIHIDNISPIPHNARVIVSGVGDPTSAIVKTRGKNLIPKVCPSQVINGITFDIQPDGSVIANGTATADAALFVLPFKNSVEMGALPKGEYYYKLFGLQSGMTATGAWYDAKEVWLGTIGVDTTGDGFSFVVDDSKADCYTAFRFNVLSGTTVNNAHIYPMLSYGEMPTAFEEYVGQDYTPTADGTVIIPFASSSMSIYTDTDGAILEVEYNADINKVVERIGEDITEAVKNINFPYAEYSLPIVYLTGSTSGISKDNKVTLNYVYGDRSGTCTLKWQGSSSVKYPKKNYTISFDNEFEAAEGWGAHKKYCLKADWIDASHLRNVISAKLWGEIVRSRPTSDLVTRLSALPNCGAIDGFPCFVVINGEWQGIYNFNIPKEDYMFGMGDGTREVILCGSNACAGNQLKDEAILDVLAKTGDTVAFDLEYASDAFAAEDIQASLNRLITACINSDGSDIDTTIAQYMDINSAIDYYIFTVLIKGGDIMDKNQIFATFDGNKWFMSAYDLDTTWGQNWDGSEILPSAYNSYAAGYSNVSFATFASFHRLMELLYRYKRADVIARYKELRGGVMSLSSVATKLYNYAGIIPISAHIAEQELWKAMPMASVKNAAQIVAWYQDRLNQVDKEIAALEEAL